MSSFTLDKLTEGIRQRHMGAQHQRLTEKWNRTGLLRGLEGQQRENMSVLLENQAAQLLREANTLGNSTQSAASGDVRGFQNVAFPIVRRVFGGLVANDLVSIQPMSLPAGLLFYLDYTYGSTQGGEGSTTAAQDGSVYEAGQSIYNSPAGKGIQSGSLATGGQYDLAGTGFSRRFVTAELGAGESLASTHTCEIGMFNGGSWLETSDAFITSVGQFTGSAAKWMQYDPSIRKLLQDSFSTAKNQGILTVADDAAGVGFMMVPTAILTGSAGQSCDFTLIKEIAALPDNDTGLAGECAELMHWGELQGGSNVVNLRRLNQRVQWTASDGNEPVAAPLSGNHILMVILGNSSLAPQTWNGGTQLEVLDFAFPQDPTTSVTGSGSAESVVVPAFESNMNATGGSVSPVIPEIDIKIESISVTAVTRKLRARWSPELAQDLNAYHSLDAEVELTQILSEQIALELDREILNDLLTQANGANLYWSRSPGKFLDKETGAEIARGSSLRPGPAFTGTVREWYETLTETIIDCANTIHRKTLRGSANFIVVGPDVATILESSVLYKPVYSLDGDGQVGNPMTIGAEKVGSLSNRFTVYKDPYFPRNKILVGYKGGSYLETGYVYAPYVPLIVTPTIFAPEDFTPRKGVMTRYGKKMVRSDFYGTVTVADLHII